MFHKLFTRRGGMAIASVALGVSGMSLAFAGTAGATTYLNPPAVILGSGSNTTYNVMSSLSTLFNQSPGTDLTAGSADNGTLQGATGSYVPGGDGENGLTAASENPYNDVTVQYAAVGSGNGVKQLYTSGDAAINYARSSATPANSHGTAAQNYVEFAIDGVSWTHFTSVNSHATVSAKIKNISEADLTSIYEGTQGCTVKGVAYTMNWICEGAKTPAPIDCYVAQTGSGTEKTWAADIVGGADAAGCLSDESVGTSASHAGLFENEVNAMFTPSGTWNNGDEADAIYYFSYGKFAQVSTKGILTVPTSVTGTSGKTTAVLGEINNIAPSQTTIQGTVGDGTPGTFPVIRYLSNVYNNTSSGTNGVATQPTLNLVGEYGFLCKPSTHTDIDPITGVNYRAEIEADIDASGFFPIDTHIATTFSEGSLTTRGLITDPLYQEIDPTYTSTNPSGYCLSVNG
jgi:ABC-type phosphate transport system substrate-binding protein